MPDVTPKPLRSRGNAVINLMGAVGGILYLALAAVLYPASRKVAGHVDYQPLFIIVSLIMAVSVLVLALTVKEKRLSEENRALEKQHPDWNLAAKDESGNEVLPKEVKRSLTFLLASISLWFIAYNGVTTWFTKYIEQVMGEGLGGASTCLLVATAGAICSYIPIGALAAKIGRKRTIQLGVALLTLCFLLGFVKQIQLGITIRVFFTGCAKLFSPGKGKAVREHCVQEFQFLCFLFQELDPCFLFLQRFFLLLTMLLHDLQQREHVLPAHFIQLFLCKNRIHHTASSF